MATLADLDGGGVVGYTLHYALVIAMVGSALLLFLYLKRKGRLDMDEEPKFQMMEVEVEKESDSLPS